MRADLQRLVTRVEDGLVGGWRDERLVPLLAELATRAPAGTAGWRLAHRELAGRLVAAAPWRASLLARELCSRCPGEAAGWALLALGQSLLGHYQYAVRAYRKALALCPDDPVCLHNLGHLIDVAFDQPRRSLGPLRRACQLRPADPDMVASYAHALARAGEPLRARELLRVVIQRGPSQEHHELYRWILEQAEGAVEALLREPSARPPVAPRRTRKRRTTAG